MATLIAPDHPSPVVDAEALRKAVQGWGTDEKGLIAILGHRNAIQRKLIRQAYEEIYQEDLLRRLEKELSGDFEKAVYRWMLDPADRDAVLANVAIKSKPVDYRVIVEISCIRSPEELLAIKRAYQLRYKHSLEEDLAAHTSGDVRKLLVALVGTFRYDGDEIDTRLANSEADILQNAIGDKKFNHAEIIRIVATRSNAQLIATLNSYRDEHGKITNIVNYGFQHLKDEPESDFLAALRNTIRCSIDPKKYHEKVIRNALSKPGTDEDALTRVIVTRAEKDLKDIQELYQHRNSVTLEHTVAKKTSGDYKAFLLTLLGKED